MTSRPKRFALSGAALACMVAWPVDAAPTAEELAKLVQNPIGNLISVPLFHGTKSMQGNARFARATQILKGDVKDRNNKDVGDIEDMGVSLPTGRVSYVVLEFDRAWTPDDKLVAMPMKVLKSEDGDGTDLVYQSNPESLKGAPSFEKNRWPDLVDGKFTSDVHRYEQNWRASPSSVTRAADKAERSAERAAEKTERAVERAAATTERAVDRVTAPPK